MLPLSYYFCYCFQRRHKHLAPFNGDDRRGDYLLFFLICIGYFTKKTTERNTVFIIIKLDFLLGKLLIVYVTLCFRE